MIVTFRGERFDVVDNELWHLDTDVIEPFLIDQMIRHLGSRSKFLDVGAWIGPFTLWGARRCRHVLAFEPDPIARAELEENVDRSRLSNVTVMPFAIAARGGRVRLNAQGDGFGSSMSTLLPNANMANGESIDALAISLDNIATMAYKFDLAKIDIEGGEYDLVMNGLGQLVGLGCPIVMSVHTLWLGKGAEGDMLQRLSVPFVVTTIEGNALSPTWLLEPR